MTASLMRATFLRFPLILLLAAACSPPPAAEPRPNIVLIMADDLGPEWISAYGAEHKTPNIDRLATEGVRFENVYSMPICTPTRHALLTGRYPFRTGWTDHHDAPRWGEAYFDWRREITFARVLKKAGYATAIAGKWQINDLRRHPRALARHGFDEHAMWTGHETGNPPSGERYWNPFFQINGRRQTHEGKFGPDLAAGFLAGFIQRHRDQPFLVYFPMILPHAPFTTTPANRDTSLTGTDLHPGMVDYVDALVGRIVAAIDDAGLREQTVIIFTCDNGSGRRLTGRLNGQPVRGGKGQLTEAGIRVPFIVRAPGLAEPGRVTTDLVDFSDILPTFADLAQADLPEGVTLDGRSFVPVLKGEAAENQKRKWIYAQRGAKRVVRDKRYKMHNSGEFYDLRADPFEQNDLSASNDPAISQHRERLREVMDSFPEDAKLPFTYFGRPPPKK